MTQSNSFILARNTQVELATRLPVFFFIRLSLSLKRAMMSSNKTAPRESQGEYEWGEHEHEHEHEQVAEM